MKKEDILSRALKDYNNSFDKKINKKTNLNTQNFDSLDIFNFLVIYNKNYKLFYKKDIMDKLIKKVSFIKKVEQIKD